MARLHVVARTGHPTFLDLPWERPLAEWESERLVELPRGISRHVVRFVEYEGRIYALKEEPERYVRREYGLLRRLGAESMPVVEAVGAVTGRADELDAILITRYLEFSLPYRALFTARAVSDLQDALLDALVHLLVRLHLAGFFWGDCSLSNTLFRRDAGGLSAYLVDAETGELHPALSDGQRAHDLDVAAENMTGELLDVQAELGIEGDILQSAETGREVVARYESLWCELTREEVFTPDERWKIDERLRRLNELGYDVEEIELVGTEDGYELRLDPHVVEPGHHRRRLLMLTGLDVQENQARRLLNDIASHRAWLEQDTGHAVPESVAAYRWLTHVYEPTIARIPEELRGKLELAEIFHGVLEQRWRLSEKAGHDVGHEDAADRYVADVLRHVTPERTPGGAVASRGGVP